MTPFAPRLPYIEVAVASFSTEKPSMSSGWMFASSVLEDSMPLIRMRGDERPVPNDPTPRTKNSALSAPGSPLSW